MYMIHICIHPYIQWEDDLSLQEAFTDSISSEATKYCSEYLEQCGLLNR